ARAGDPHQRAGNGVLGPGNAALLGDLSAGVAPRGAPADSVGRVDADGLGMEPQKSILRQALCGCTVGPSPTRCFKPKQISLAAERARFVRFLRASVSSTGSRKPIIATYEVGGQLLVTKGVQPPPPEPDGHVSVHPALQYRVLRMKAESPIR